VQNLHSAVWFRNWEVVRDESDRAPNLFDERRPDDPLILTQQTLRERFKELCVFSRAVSFAASGK
jgi:hypothetical protein